MRKAAVRAVGPVFAAVFTPTMFAAPAQPPGANVGIIISEASGPPLGEGYLGAHYIKNLSARFGFRGELIRCANYRPGQIAQYRAAFYNGGDTTTGLPEEFLKDVKCQSFCWPGHHMDQLLAGPGARRQFGFGYSGYDRNRTDWRVRYRDTLFPRDNFNSNVIEALEGSRAEVRATAAQGDSTRLPYALKRRRFWYFADKPLSAQEGNRCLVLCDLLNDVLEIDHAPQSLALAGVEDFAATAPKIEVEQGSSRTIRRME
jgi:hypothetical protein